MSKRYGQNFDNCNSSQAKKAKIECPRGGIVPKEKKQSIAGVSRIPSDDLWGDDFDDDAIEELDFIASQACSQDVNVPTSSRMSNNVSRVSRPPNNFQPVASTSRASGNGLVNCQVFKLKEQHKPSLGNKSITGIGRNNSHVPSQRLASSDNIREMVDEQCSLAFDEFKTNLLGRGQLNSTFNARNDLVIVSDDTRLRQMEKLEHENKKLLDDFMTKEGETVFLRNQLQQTVLRAENEKAEKARLIDEQASRYRSEINALHKEKDSLKTQYDFQALQLGNLMERCKLLETRAVKLTAPQKAVMANDSPNRRLALLNRSMSSPKPVKVAETSVQTSGFNRSCWDLKTLIQDHPLDRIPQSIFEPPLPEKSVVDIQIVEKFGKKNLPILQEEDTFRIFENPDLVKPLVSVVDGSKLDVKYFMPEVAVIMRMTSAEINSKNCIPIVNKIVSTTRELLLNSTVVLQTISSAMKNDDIRDMNDLFFSTFYDTKIDNDKTICDSKSWYDKERGIESRRSMGIISHIAEESNYLSEYIAGKAQLFVNGDESYANYEKQMIRYSAWHKKGHDFELLEMILEFVTVLGLVRRSHQFTGLICAIVKTLSNVQKKVGFCPKGLQYVSNIFKELVFSRPLAHCFVPMTEMMEIFCKSVTFGQKLCTFTPNATSLSSWKGQLHFTPDACLLEIYLTQLERFTMDPLTTVDISHAILSCVHFVFLLNSIPWTTESSNSCGCCMKFLTYSITLLCNCSKIDIQTLEQQSNSLNQTFAKLDDNFWRRIKRKQLNVFRKGIRFLSYLAKRDPDFIIRDTLIEDSFNLFIKRVSAFDGLMVHENEEEALALIKSTLICDKSTSTERRSQPSQNILRIRSAFQPKSVPSPSSGKFYDIRKNSSSQQSIALYRNVLNG